MEFRKPYEYIEPEISDSGEIIYKWDYLDKNNEIKSDERNVYEQIQSYERTVNYKEQIARGEDYGADRAGAYMDISEIGHNNTDLDRWLVGIADSLKAIQEQNTKNNPVTVEGGKASIKDSEAEGQTGGEK